jgi:hypothetical protein
VRIFFKLFGVYWAFGSWFGNCFSPAIVLEYLRFWPFGHGAWFILTLRWNHKETRFYFGRPVHRRTINPNMDCTFLPRFWWNSDHLARRYGEPMDLWNGDVAYCWHSRWLGFHQCV